MNKVKFFVLISILCLMIVIPTSFAADGQTAVAIDEAVDNLTLASDGSDVLASDWYFDSNAEDDTGNGSITSPYKLLSSGRINSNSILHLANGNYTLKGYNSINNVTIIGDDPLHTILRYSGKQFSGSTSLTLKNLTLINLRIINSNLTAINTIFKDSQYSSSNGAVIESSSNYFMNLNNCTFSNNYAKYGGAIYLNKGTLTVTDSLFINNKANIYGGAIVGIGSADIRINNSKFLNSYSINDAGGAIYLLNSTLMAYNLEINNCSSTFGGAITSLKSTLNLNNFTGKNNKAKYDGGAIYAMYRSFNMDSSLLQNNTAENAGAVYVYNVDDFLISNTRFTENHAGNCASAFYSVFLQDPYYDSILDSALNNTFSNNNPSENDVLEANLPVLSIGSGNFTLYKTDFSENYTIPSSYDLRDLGLVSSVKNQGSDGNCWAFATLGALESSILKATGIEFDLSEQNMKNLISLYSAYGWNKIETNEGGYSRMGLGYLTGWLGPINESDDEYKLDTALSPVLNSIMHVQNILFLKRDNYTDNDEIKLAVMKYGGVAASIYYESTYMKDRKNYYYTGNQDTNHLVVIVGWDDNYSKSNFKSTPPGDGAWIFKNSWGPYQGENGYYYVSYYDTKFANVGDYDPFVFVLNDTIKYDKNYQYDIPGITDYFLIQTNELWYKNKFTATDNEYLAAVSTYFIKETAWDLSVYVNNVLKLTQSGSAVPSYKTINLNQLIKLNKGDVFEIVFKVTVENEACLPISEFVSLNTEFYSKDMSYVSYDGNNWKDLYNLTWAYSSHTYASQVACIKAFTVLNPIETSLEFEVVSQYNPAQFNVIVKDQYGNLVKSGSVKFAIDGKRITVNVVNGIASLNYLFDNRGNKLVSAQFSATGYVSSSTSVIIKIFDKINSTLSASKLITVYGSGDELVATLKDASGNPIGGADVIIALGDINTTVVTDSEGKARLDVTTFKPNVYFATIYFDGNYKYNPSVKENVKVYVQKISTDLTAPDVFVVYNSGGKLIATLNDVNGNVISNAKVYFTVNGVQTTLTTNSKGQAKLSTNGLSIGNYTVGISYKASTYYYASSTNARIIITDKMDSVLSASKLTTVYGSGDKLVASLKDVNGKAIGSTNVIFSIGDINTTVVTDSSGKARLDVTTFTPKVYYATIYFAGNSIYNPCVKENVKVYVQKISTTLTADTYGGNLVATLKDANGQPINKAKVYVTIYGVKSTLTTNSTGQAKLSSDLSIGNYTAEIVYKASSYYYGSNTTANMVIKDKINTTLSANKLITVYDSGDELVVTLKDSNGKAISGANIVIALGDVNTTVVTDSSGKARLDVTTFTPKVYYATIYYIGDNTHNPCVKENVKVYVQKISTTLTAPDINVPYGSGNLVATLKDANGNAIGNAKVYITVDGVKTTLTTDSNGKVTFSTNSLSLGSHVAEIEYKASTYYYACTTTANITIKSN